MSKAFTSEDTATETALTREPPKLAPGEKRYITPEGYQALQQELARLAREQPADPRTQWLRAALPILTVVPPKTDAEGRIFFGAWVTLEDEEGEQKTYRIVGPDEADAKAGLLSVESPLARALLKKEEGDTVTFARPLGRTELTIVGVRYGA